MVCFALSGPCSYAVGRRPRILSLSSPSEIIDFATSADSGYMPGAGITGPAGAAAGGATAAASLGVNIAAGGVKNVTSSTGYLVDKTTDQIVQQVVNYYNRQGWQS